MGEFKFEAWPTEFHRITQHFGVNPHNYAQFGLPGHDGIDIRAHSGSQIFCVAPGRVSQVYRSAWGHNYGIHVRVDHQDGYQTIYGHLQRPLVEEGQEVATGGVLGLADDTGNSFGSHLHLGLKRPGANNGWPHDLIDPTPFLLPLLGWIEPAGPFIEGWLLSDTLFSRGRLGQVNVGGATLYVNPERKVSVPGGTMVILEREQAPFARVKAPLAAVGLDAEAPPTPAPEPPAIVSTVEGWAWRHYLTVVNTQAIVGAQGVNVRAGPEREAANIGIVKAGSTLSLTGAIQGHYAPVRARRNDFLEPVALPKPPPDPSAVPPAEGLWGWALSQYLSPLPGRQALASRMGVNLRSKPDPSGLTIGLVKAFATVSIAGRDKSGYTPILVRREEVLNAAEPTTSIEMPDPLNGEAAAEPLRQPDADSTPGWVFSNGLVPDGGRFKVGYQGSNLRAAPRRDAQQLGFIPPWSYVSVTGPAQGEYTPVRVSDEALQAAGPERADLYLDGAVLGGARIGLHASMDIDISPAEHDEFAQLRPGLIKVLSYHNPADVARLAAAHPDAHWIIRAYLPFGERPVSPDEFISQTIIQTRRILAPLRGRQVVIELHNEPNTAAGGLGSAWSDGRDFAAWWCELLAKYRRALPGMAFIYPGLSPGSTVTGVKLDHIRFLEESRPAVEGADGLGLHLYWSPVAPMAAALATLDDVIARFRSRPVWVSEAARRHGLAGPLQMAREYLRFWGALQERPVVRGVAFFVASARDPKLADQVWLGKGIGRIIGKR